MKFVEYNAMKMIQQSSLQIALIVMTLAAFSFGSMNVFLGIKDPVVIERGCETRLAEIQSSNQSKEEIQEFLKVAIASRFDSNFNLDLTAYLSDALIQSRYKEQTELKSKNIDQRVLVRSIKLSQNQYLIEADRIISIDKIRSALPLELTVMLASKVRSLSNPYGLLVTQIEQTKKEEKPDDSNN